MWLDLALSSRGLGHMVLIHETGVRLPVALLFYEFFEMRIFSACLIFALALFFLLFSTANAQVPIDLPKFTDGQINEALAKTVPVRFLPDNPLYLLIRGKEAFTRFFQPSSKEKAQFDLVLSGKRLKESYTLLKKGDVKNSSESLKDYAKRMKIFGNQIKKAKMQNQDVASIIGKVSDDLGTHEVLLSASAMFAQKDDAYNFESNYSGAIEAFSGVVNVLDQIKPGIKDRYVILRVKPSPTPLQSPHPVNSSSPQIYDSTGSVKPRRIIY